MLRAIADAWCDEGGQSKAETYEDMVAGRIDDVATAYMASACCYHFRLGWMHHESGRAEETPHMELHGYALGDLQDAFREVIAARGRPGRAAFTPELEAANAEREALREQWAARAQRGG